MRKNTAMYDLSNIIERIDMKNVQALDSEGAPRSVTQVSVVDGNENSAFNTYCPSGRLSDGKREALNTVLGKARILIGFSLESDLQALAKQGVSAYSDTIIVDLYVTSQELIAKGMINAEKLNKQDLQGIAEYYGIKNVSGYHNSLVDATVTMKLFWEMNRVHNGVFWVLSREEETPVQEEKKEVTENMEINGKTNSMGVMDYSYENPDVIFKASSNLYEAVIMVGRREQLVRMTGEEYDLFTRIQKFAPGYPLSMFYLTILAPGAMSEVRKYARRLEGNNSEDWSDENDSASYEKEVEAVGYDESEEGESTSNVSEARPYTR